MGFVFLNIGLMIYAKDTSIKLKFYIKNIKYLKDGSVLLTEKKVEKQEIKVEK